MMHSSRPQRGFTLIELSIVLVVIGLAVGGVLVGQSLIRSAQIQSVMTDVTKYTESVHQFQQKYNALPGDMPNATTYWGANGPGICGSLYTASTSPTSTCNGSGDGIIDGIGATKVGGNAYESLYAWKHLSNAGFIEGSFTGKDVGSAGMPQAGINVPASRVTNAGFYITNNLDFWGPGGGQWVYPWTKVTHILLFGSGYLQLGAVITASEAYSIDSKSDDGKPGTGKIKSPRAGNGAGWGTDTCATSSDANAAVYNTNQSGIICSLILDIE